MTRELRQEHSPVLFLLATHGEGEPTDNASQFYAYMNEAGRAVDEMTQALRYSRPYTQTRSPLWS